VPVPQLQQTQASIVKLVREASNLASSQVPNGEVQIPPSYAKPIIAQMQQLQSAYQQVGTTVGSTIGADQLAQARAAAGQAAAQVTAIYKKAASTPLLLLSAQVVLDQHGFAVDLHDKFSQVLKTLSDQVTSLLNNAISVGVQAGNLLIDVVLVFIMSIYFIVDGSRFIQWIVRNVPKSSRPQVSGAIANLDNIFGRYIRTQFILALVAGTLDAVGALIIGVPYPASSSSAAFSCHWCRSSGR